VVAAGGGGLLFQGSSAARARTEGGQHRPPRLAAVPSPFPLPLWPQPCEQYPPTCWQAATAPSLSLPPGKGQLEVAAIPRCHSRAA